MPEQFEVRWNGDGPVRRQRPGRVTIHIARPVLEHP
jgi:hypothetical protein